MKKTEGSSLVCGAYPAFVAKLEVSQRLMEMQQRQLVDRIIGIAGEDFEPGDVMILDMTKGPNQLIFDYRGVFRTR